jgi:hypothetical protein
MADFCGSGQIGQIASLKGYRLRVCARDGAIVSF